MSYAQERDPLIERMVAEPDVGPYADVERKFRHMRPELFDLDAYNFEHFRTKHLAYDARATLEQRGIPAGEPAPDFEIPRVDGGTLRLSELRGRPVLLHFGSFT
jgi:hypothetical protein